MASSLSKIKNQIQKLQKQAASIQSTVIARIKREIAQHGLNVDDLFSFGSTATAVKARPAGRKNAAGAKKSSGANKPAKFADGKGNTWHGIGKRPQWIHDVLAAGHKLDDFLVGEKKDGAAAAKSAPKAGVKAAAKTPRKAAAKKTAAKKTAVTKTTAAKKTTKAPAAKKAAGKAAAKKVPAKRAAKVPAQSAAASADAS